MERSEVGQNVENVVVYGWKIAGDQRGRARDIGGSKGLGRVRRYGRGLEGIECLGGATGYVGRKDDTYFAILFSKIVLEYILE